MPTTAQTITIGNVLAFQFDRVTSIIRTGA